MASIKDVAQRAGVSFSTVSIIINGKAAERKISEETQHRVREAMRELSYRPNISAKRLKEGERGRLVVALFWSFDFRRAMLARFLGGLQDRIREERANIEIVVYPYQSGDLDKETALVQGSQFHAAVIANASDEDMAYLNSIEPLVPLILYNRYSEKYSSVNIEDRRVGWIAAEHLYAQGYRSAAVITSEADFSGMRMREEAFGERFEALGGRCPGEAFVAENSVEGGVACGEGLLGQMDGSGSGEKGRLPGGDVDCVFCASDALAIGAVHVLLDAGVRIPEDLAVLAVGNGNPHYSCYHNPPLTVIDIPMEKMAYRCFDLIAKQMDSQGGSVERIILETELLARKSTQEKGAAGEKAAGEGPAEKEPAGEEPAGEKAAGEGPAGEKAAGKKAGE